MLKRFSNNVAFFSILVDNILIMVSLKIATLIRPYLSPWANWIKDIENPPVIEFRFYIIFSIIWITAFFIFSVYNPYKHLRFFEELSSLIGGCLVATITIPGFLYFLNRDMSRVLYASFAVITSFLLISYRMIYRFGFSKGIIKTHENRRILIVGAGLVGRNLSREIENYHGLGFEVIGYVDDDINLIKTQKDVLGNLDQTRKIIKKHNIRHLIITLPRRAHDRISYLISEVHQLPIRIWVIPDYFSLALNQAKVSEFAGFPMIDLRAPALNQYQRLTKRVFDLVICIPSLIFTLPIMGIISILIKLDSQGSVIYKSKRIKENGELFDMLKFRTMEKDADKKLDEVIQYDKDGNLIHKRPNDPRVTKIGKLLRKTSLDELPQIINIIKGDMSLIGPRPELPEMVERYEPWQRARFAVPQGLTGWWQVNGRSDKPMHLHTEEDLYYIQHYSIWLDIRILLKTILIVIKGKGAY